MKKIVVIGVGGRTGTMLAFELRNSAEILGIGKEEELKIIKEGRLCIEREDKIPEVFEGKVIKDTEFQKSIRPEIIFLATKNPVGPAVKYYYQKLKLNEKKLPALVLSQNGIVATKEAKSVLKEVLGKRAEEVRIIRISLFNPVEKKEVNDKIYINYFLPIRLSFGIFSGPKETQDIVSLFKNSGFEIKEIPPEKIEDMEFSKLLTNLIGIASASKGLSIEEGFRDKEIFKEEIGALKEYIIVVKARGGNFLNLPHYPLKLLSFLINLPVFLLLPFRKILAKLVTRDRGKKPKGNLDEIDYYNGAVIELGKKMGIETPINEEIYKKVKQILSGRVRT